MLINPPTQIHRQTLRTEAMTAAEAAAMVGLQHFVRSFTLSRHFTARLQLQSRLHKFAIMIGTFSRAADSTVQPRGLPHFFAWHDESG